LLTVGLFSLVSPVAHAYGATDLISGLTALDQQIHGKAKLTAPQRAAVHRDKAALIAAGGYTGMVHGVSYADVMINLDCIGSSLQHARNAPRSNKRLERFWANKALACQHKLATALKAAGQAPASVLNDMGDIAGQLVIIKARIDEGHVFGAKSTTLRHFLSGVATGDFNGPLIYGLPFSEHYRAIECIDVKVESGRISGASACVHRLRRLLRRHVTRVTAHVSARAHAAAEADAGFVIDSLEKLDHRLAGLSSLTEAERGVVHSEKATFVAQAYGRVANGVTHADVLNNLDCVDTELQIARNSNKKSRQKSQVAKAMACEQRLSAALSAGGRAPGALTADMAKLRGAIAAVAKRVKQGRVFGSKTRAVRDQATAIVGRHFSDTLYGVSFAEHFRDLECIDVKVESGRISGASSCARRLIRLIRANKPPKPAITFGSDLTGDPVAFPGVWREDSEFWTEGTRIPVSGTITQFKLRVGSDPVTLPVRFSVVEPQPDGRMKVLTTTNPPYIVPGGSPGVYTVDTHTFSFKCCKVKRGDYVTVDNRGAEETQAPYAWFARKPNYTTFSHMEAGVSQDAGQLWRPDPHPGFEVLLQITMIPD
jgi:hypothetical protein